MENIASRVKTLTARKLKLPLDRIYNTSNFVEDMGADDIDLMELTVEFEEEFGISIIEDAYRLTTVGAFVEYVSAKLKK